MLDVSLRCMNAHICCSQVTGEQVQLATEVRSLAVLPNTVPADATPLTWASFCKLQSSPFLTTIPVMHLVTHKALPPPCIQRNEAHDSALAE